MKCNIALFLLFTLQLGWGAPAGGREVAPEKKGLAIDQVPDMVRALDVVPSMKVELKYATADNFMKQNLYGDFRECYLHRDAAAMLARAAEVLKTRAPSLRLLAYDCLRPRRVQLKMWDAVKGTPKQGFVADPHSRTGSLHNYGCAIDLTLADEGGKPIDMGTPFDFFGKEASTRAEADLAQQGKLTLPVLSNRLLLREVMTAAGFLPIPSEWWHFNCARDAVVRTKYKIVD